MRWWRKDLKVGERRRGQEDPKHHRLMCASPGSSEESLVTHWRSSHSQAGSFGLKGLSGEISGWGLQGWVWRGSGPGSRLCGWESREQRGKPSLSQCSQARAHGSSASGPVPLTSDWELNFIPRIL